MAKCESCGAPKDVPTLMSTDPVARLDVDRDGLKFIVDELPQGDGYTHDLEEVLAEVEDRNPVLREREKAEREASNRRWDENARKQREQNAIASVWLTRQLEKVHGLWKAEAHLQRRAVLMGDTNWWIKLMEPGDPLFFNYPDADLFQTEPYRFVGIMPEGENRAGQPIYDEWVVPRESGMFSDGEPRWERKVGWCLIPVPMHSEPWVECQAGKWKGTREELVAAWRTLGVDVPPAHWLDRELTKVLNGHAGVGPEEAATAEAAP